MDNNIHIHTSQNPQCWFLGEALERAFIPGSKIRAPSMPSPTACVCGCVYTSVCMHVEVRVTLSSHSSGFFTGLGLREEARLREEASKPQASAWL